VHTLQTTIVTPDAQGLQLLAHIPLSTLGAPSARGNDIWGWTDPMTGTEIAIVGTSTGTSFVDLSLPQAPKVLGFLPSTSDQSTWRDMKVYRDHVYIVSEAALHGLQIFDLKHLRDITTFQEFSADAVIHDFGSAHNIEINTDTGFAYVVGSKYPSCFGGLLMYDLTQPLAPVLQGCFSGGLPAGQSLRGMFPDNVYTHDVQCVTYAGPDTQHTGAEVCFSSDQQTMGIADVSDKSNVQQLARVTYEGAGYTHQGWLTQDHRYFLLNDEFDEVNLSSNTLTYVWDVSDLENPILVGTITNPRDAIGHNTYVKDNIAYQANYTSGLRLLDLSNIDTLAQGGEVRELAYYDTFPNDDSSAMAACAPLQSCSAQATYDGAWSVYPFFESNILIVSDIQRGLFVLQRRL